MGILEFVDYFCHVKWNDMPESLQCTVTELWLGLPPIHPKR